MRNDAVVDSGPLLALFDRDDAHHARVASFLKANPRLRLSTTWPVLTETCALLASRVGKQAEADFLDWIDRGGLSLADQGVAAFSRIRALVAKYRDLPFDFADASVAVLAETGGLTQVLTLDGDFEIYRDARGKPLENLLETKRVKLR